MNLFQALPATLTQETFETLVEAPGFKIERIVSKGHSSPDGFWYDQDQSEWVTILQGHAIVRVEGQAEPIELRVGDTWLIPANQKHRVEATSSIPETIWLAVFFAAKGA